MTQTTSDEAANARVVMPFRSGQPTAGATEHLPDAERLCRLRDGAARLASRLMTVARRRAWRARNVSRTTIALDEAQEDSEDLFAEWTTVITLHEALATLGGQRRGILEEV